MSYNNGGYGNGSYDKGSYNNSGKQGGYDKNNGYQKNEKAKDDEVGAIWGPYKSKNGKEYFKLEINGQKLIAFPNQKGKDIHPDFRVFKSTPPTNGGGNGGGSYQARSATPKENYAPPQNNESYNGGSDPEDDFPNF
ncbi:MAG: hypothetical protein ACRCXX_14480 [Cetobacterium sp.]|uniref:hypothetical protein n=1 Tax=Cetobacterium sp. TaxID=2071632 RepID=UPI003F374236